jgi:TRAP-type mannitol/chloroaromatic compound transport system substrate-binding protein
LKRRKFLQAGAAAAVAGPALAAPAIAQATPEVTWRLTSSFHKSHDVLFGTAQTICRFVAEATDSKFRIQPFAAGELVPGTQALDAVTSNAVSVDCAHTPLDIYFAKDPALAFGTGIPFGLNGRHHWAWWAFGGGAEIVNAALKKFNAYGFAAGLTGPQMGAWMRKEISSVEDLKGMKFRINGMGAMIIERVGAVSLQMPMSDVVIALEQGLIDAAEHACPYDDERLGLPKVAKYNYYPGWWKSAGMIHLVVNLEKWNALPKAYQASLARACDSANGWMLGKYDTLNPAALRRLVAAGTVLRPFPPAVLEACRKATSEYLDELAVKSAHFRKGRDSLNAFRNEQQPWWQVAEQAFDSATMIGRS